MYSPAFPWSHSSLITNQKQPGGPSPSLAGSPSLRLLFFFLFCSPRLFLESSRLSSKGSQAVTCLSDPLFLPSSFLLSGPWRCPGRILRFATFVRSYLPSIRDFSPYLIPSHPSCFSPSLHFCEKEMRYVFIVDIYISLLRAKTRELQIAVSRLIRSVTRDSNTPRWYNFQIYTLSRLGKYCSVYAYST